MMSEKQFFCCIGAQKSGTTWLGKTLAKHPEIWVHPLKEIHYFDYLHCDNYTNQQIFNIRKRSWVNYLKSVDYNQFNKSLLEYQIKHIYSLNYDDEWYKMLFKPLTNDIKAYGELTPSYCRLGEAGMLHMKQINPDMKVIFLMRKPSDRLNSALKMFIRNNPFNLKTIPDRKLIKFLNNPDNLELSDYRRTLNNLSKVFEPQNVLVEFYENIFESTLKTELFLKNICNFLKISEKLSVFEIKKMKKFNSTINYTLSKNVENEIVKLTTGIAKEVELKIGNIPQSWKV